jgi:hypothetical protein
MPSRAREIGFKAPIYLAELDQKKDPWNQTRYVPNRAPPSISGVEPRHRNGAPHHNK